MRGSALTAALQLGDPVEGDGLELIERSQGEPLTFAALRELLVDQPLDLRGGITVEDNVWIGAGATIMDGVTIGRDAIVTAGSVVITNVPAYAVAKGSPAKVVHDRRELEAKAHAIAEGS